MKIPQFFFAFAFLVGCSTRIINHDENSAGKSAIEFAKKTFIAQDFQSGYQLLSENGKRFIEPTRFEQAVRQIHPTSFPTIVTAKEYEPIPGKKLINIFLEGDSISEKFYYRIALEGTSETGYHVEGFYRGKTPYPPSNFRQNLKIPLTSNF